MTTTIRLTTIAFVAACGLLLTSTARADHEHDRLDRLAVRLQAESRTLYRELRSTRSYDPDLRMATNEVAQIYRDATHIHDLIHHGFDLDHLHRDVISLERQVHHVAEHLGHYRHFRRHVERMDSLVHQIDESIHDLEDRRHYSRRPAPGAGFVGRPAFGGATFGGSGFTIRIGR